ncbi:MAG: ACP S-malonyltransferase [Firmicutes bacterium]|jgi:[acyl-carrier-protein] S-malonyltransferase|nr:ACP S-malonyltransferase [Bacillota bacterium]
MGKCAFLFPGQGAQYVGMGKEMAENFPASRAVFEEADDILGYKLSNIIFQGEKKDLKKTEITQPAVLTTSIAILKVLREEGINPEGLAGLSLGEYSALVCAGVISFSDALLIVQKRSQYMQEAVPLGEGGMAAILGLTPEEVRIMCEQSMTLGHVEPANYNCPGQIVIAGHMQAVEEVCRLAKEKKARAVVLSVSVPFHCRLLYSIKDKMSALLENVPFFKPCVPFVSNVSANYLWDPEEIKRSLVVQVYSPVYWENSMRLLLKDGYDIFIEIGPGRVLTGFMKKISNEARAIHVEDKLTLARLITLLQEVQP